MTRRLLTTVLGCAVWLGASCTSSDREYVRNHIVYSDVNRPELRGVKASELAADTSPERR